MNPFKPSAKPVAASPGPQKNAAPKKSAPPANVKPEAQIVELICWRVPKNPQLITAHAPDADPSNPNNILSVLVATNRFFRPGMVCPCRCIGPGRYELVGQCPRDYGRW